MSILQDCDHSDITEFNGPNLIVDEEDVQEPQGLLARNCEYVEGQVRTRRGFVEVWNPNKIIQYMYNWVQQQYNRLIYMTQLGPSNGDVVSRDLVAGTEFTLIAAVVGQSMTCVQAGYRLFMSFFNDAGVGSSYAKVWDGTFTGLVPNVEDVFHPTITTADLLGGAAWGNVTELPAGSVTVGEHLFLLVPTTWNGFQTQPGPTALGTISPLAFTAAGGTQLELEVFPATQWPNWVNELQVAMTTVGNPNRWFLVPGATFFPLRGTSTHAVFFIDIDDVTLTGGGPTEITDTLFNLYTAATLVHVIIAYNNRNVYLTRAFGPDLLSLVGTILVSEPFNPQSLTTAEHVLNLPEFRDITTGFSLGSSLYICGPSWTYVFTDNLRVPVLWSPPRRVSGSIGSPFIHGVSNNEARGYAWVCDRTGLYYFDGSTFPILPASHQQTTVWNRINFAAHAHSLKVLELADDRLVIVRVPLDGATHSTHLMVWDYTAGVRADKIKYCGLWNLSEFPGIGDIEIVQAVASKVKQLWISRGDAVGDVKRRRTVEDGDATDDSPAALYDDDGQGIDSAYRIIAVSKAAEGVLQQVGASFRIRGAGELRVLAYSFDQQRQTPLAPIAPYENSMAPGQRFLRLLDEQSESVSYEVNNNAVAGSFFWWSAVRCYYLRWMAERS